MSGVCTSLSIYCGVARSLKLNALLLLQPDRAVKALPSFLAVNFATMFLSDAWLDAVTCRKGVSIFKCRARNRTAIRIALSVFFLYHSGGLAPEAVLRQMLVGAHLFRDANNKAQKNAYTLLALLQPRDFQPLQCI